MKKLNDEQMNRAIERAKKPGRGLAAGLTWQFIIAGCFICAVLVIWSLIKFMPRLITLIGGLFVAGCAIAPAPYVSCNADRTFCTSSVAEFEERQ
jgi:hypothetical protein